MIHSNNSNYQGNESPISREELNSIATALESISVVMNDNNQPTVMALEKLSINQEAQKQEAAQNWGKMFQQISGMEERINRQKAEIENLKDQSKHQTTWLKEHINVTVIAGFAAILGMIAAASIALLYTFLSPKLDSAIEKKINFLYNQEVEKLPKAGKPPKKKN
jgi:oligoribonuclease (3'-5' exoribonuclease)